MSAQHTPGPWSVDTVRNAEGEYGDGGPDSRTGFNAFAILNAEGRVLFDSLNRDGSACEVTEDFDEDGGSAWDAKAKADAERIVQCVNSHDDLAALLQETLRPGAYGIGSTLAARIEAALAKAGVQP